MDSIIAVASWAQHTSPQPDGTPPNHFRPLSSMARSLSPSPRASKSRSSSVADKSTLSSIPSSPGLCPTATSRPDDDYTLSTLADPRSRAMSPENESEAETPNHPDLNAEVATLSSKLINAINHQATLDGTLLTTRQELERARDRIKQLEEQNESQRQMLTGDIWIRRKTAEDEKKTIILRVAQEKKLREDAEKKTKRIELELESLTTALFEEANNMVISAKDEARLEQEALQKKNDHLRSQLGDMEALLTSQQQQLADLKHVMEQMTTEKEDATTGTAPSSPHCSKHATKDDERCEGLAASPIMDPASPTCPTSLTHLIQPVLRIDLGAYEDFISLTRTYRNRAGSRVSSGSVSSLHGLGLGMGGGSTSSAHPSNASTASSSAAGTPTTSSPQSPSTLASVPSTASYNLGPPLPALKETKFFKRVLVEDVEPTLRLDIAPGLSWLARRSVLNAMSDGSIVVEPIPANTPFASHVKSQFYYSCSLCGEARKNEQYLRTYRFRTSESESAQRYPLCKYCLGRVRSTCDFLNFLRILKDGHWRAEGEDAVKMAWEESVRLREQMFWSRIGGGVVPASHPAAPSDKSSRVSLEIDDGKVSPQPSMTAATSPDEDATPFATPLEKAASSKDMSISPARPELRRPSNQNSIQYMLSNKKDVAEKDGEQRLYINIPSQEAQKPVPATSEVAQRTDRLGLLMD